MKKFVYIWILIALFFSGCKREEAQIFSPKANFEALWKIIDENYCFFEYKNIDWNEVYRRYEGEVSESMTQYELFDLLSKMLNELKDGHTNLTSSFNTSRYWSWFEDYPPNFYDHIQKSYLGKSAENKKIGGVYYCMLEKEQVGYIYYSSFSDAIGEGNLDNIFHYFKDCKGLIIDIRNNGGGSLSNSNLIASRFFEGKTLTGYIQYKRGKNHDDFSEPYPVYLNPSSHKHWNRPTIVITNRQCYSAANDFVQKIRLSAHVITLGDRTGGGSGFPIGSELPNGWSIRFSACPILDIDKAHTEFGIDPDIRLDITEQDLQKGKDTLIEAAIRYLLYN